MRPYLRKTLVFLLVVPPVLYYLYYILPTTVEPLTSHSFNPSGSDILVFVHIQKTSGSNFLDYLTTVSINGENLCTPTNKKVKQASCTRPGAKDTTENWLVSERTVGWICGVHATYPEMRACLPHRLDVQWGPNSSRRLLYVTLVRHPVIRYVSEYMHVRRGATWSRRRTCSGKEVTDIEMPPCYSGFYEGSQWPNLTIEAFVFCESNWARNRQTLALADLQTCGCFNRTAWKHCEVQLVESAKANLKNMAFFGLTEYQEETTALFQATFGVTVDRSLEQRPFSVLHSFKAAKEIVINHTLYQNIVDANLMDIQLYQFALRLFASRLRSIGIRIDMKKVDQEVLH